ncbi:unnamed protein product [Larinioides sclopetarius]|uniref:Uncharacterized protein n=1 Tax=Larinioides sclopetarius TaxID=280406 RepID=A0AAV2BSB1_9ARAC
MSMFFTQGPTRGFRMDQMVPAWSLLKMSLKRNPKIFNEQLHQKKIRSCSHSS